MTPDDEKELLQIEVLVRTEQFEEAVRFIDLLPDNARSPETAYVKAICLISLNRYDAAKTILLSLTDSAPTNIELALTYSELLIRMNQHNDALERLLKIAEIAPTHPEVFSHIGAIYLFQNKIETASGYFEKAHALEPDELEYAISYAVCKFQHDDFERVETICQSVGNKGKDCFELQSIRAKAAIKANRLHLAKTVLTHLIQMDPNEPNHQIDAGMVAMMLDDPEAAATHWAAAVRLAPEYLPVFNELVSLLLEMNRPKEVIQLAILLKKYPEAIHSASIWIATGYLALNQLENATAEIQFLSGQVQESLNAINQSIANNPDNDSLHAIKESIQTRAAGPPH